MSSPITPRTAGGPRAWTVTGVAGFIGSHLLEVLLHRGHRVAGLDDFSTGKQANLEEVRLRVGEDAWGRFRLVSGDIRDPGAVRHAVEGADFVLHHAAMVSVPGSVHEPGLAHAINVDGTLNVFQGALRAGVRRVVYASSSAVYGDCTRVPVSESDGGRMLSPYAANKRVNELYAEVFESCYGLSSVGLRYFNVFGPRQDPKGPYAAVVPRWICAALTGADMMVFGDGGATRDLCPVSTVVDAVLAAAVIALPTEAPRVYNVASGVRLDLLTVASMIRAAVSEVLGREVSSGLVHGPERPGDVRHSGAEVARMKEWLGVQPDGSIRERIRECAGWYAEGLRSGRVTG